MPLMRTAVRLALEIVCARTPAVLVVLVWYPRRIAASKLSSIPSIIIRGRGQERTSWTSGGRRSMRRFSPFPCESETTISVAPASLAAAMAAFTSFVMISRNRAYSKPDGPS